MGDLINYPKIFRVRGIDRETIQMVLKHGWEYTFGEPITLKELSRLLQRQIETGEDIEFYKV